jgi:DNA-binding NarL/FixJ family response regulator
MSTRSQQEDLDIVGEAGDGLEAAEMARVLRPDLVLMDL